MYYIKAILIFLCFWGILTPAVAQKKATIQILHSDFYKPEKNSKKNKLIGNVKLQHQDMIMTCDSLYQYSDSNFIEAFGNVHAVQNDTINLWGDFLDYNGNTELARVRDNVIMKDKKITLTTDFLDYNAKSKVGYYFNTGTIKDDVNTLISEQGYYYTQDDQMFFKDSVKVYTPDYKMYSDTLKYHTLYKIITILGPTNIYGENRHLYSENGWYNSISSQSELYKNNKIYYNEYIGYADTIVIDSISQQAIMRNNIHLFDTVNNVIVEGHYGQVNKNNDYAFVTQRAMLTLVGDPDSLFIHGDTLSVNKDTAGNNIMKAYYHTKFFNKDLQGLCDSMVFPVADSTVYLYGKPIVWAAGNQMTAELITMLLSDNKVKQFDLKNQAMMVNEIPNDLYNQIKGKHITGYMDNRNEIYLVDVVGSGETIYYPDDQGVIMGLNRTISSNIKIHIKDRKAKDIIFIKKPEGGLTPLFMVKPEEKLLKDFHWYIDQKPLSKEDIFIP